MVIRLPNGLFEFKDKYNDAIIKIDEKNKDITSINFNKLYIEREKIEIKLEEQIYKNYKNDIDEIFKKEI